MASVLWVNNTLTQGVCVDSGAVASDCSGGSFARRDGEMVWSDELSGGMCSFSERLNIQVIG